MRIVLVAVYGDLFIRKHEGTILSTAFIMLNQTDDCLLWQFRSQSLVTSGLFRARTGVIHDHTLLRAVKPWDTHLEAVHLIRIRSRGAALGTRFKR